MARHGGETEAMSNQYAIDKTLTANELRFHYRDWGGRGWPVLLLHGLSSTSHIWDLAAPLLVKEARVIALDLRGHGQSDKPDEDYSYEAVGGDVFDAIAQLEMDNPVIVGHSWGANVGLWVAARDPDVLAGLIMVDGGFMDLSDLTWEETLERLSPPRIGGMPVGTFRAMLLENAPEGLITPTVEAAILANFEIDAENRIHRRLSRESHLRILREMWETPLAPLYEHVECPVLILPCRRDGDEPELIARKEKGVARAKQLMPDAEVVWLEDTVHDAPLQRPGRLTHEIVRFIHERI
jgi:pimeloyl-ACP methyl ester carboxylesterase